ncbi:unnamed protein product [Urochloa humidicola]
MILHIRSCGGTDRITIPNLASSTIADLWRLSLAPALLLPGPSTTVLLLADPVAPLVSPTAPSSTSPTRPTHAPSALRRLLLRQEDDHGRPHRAPDPRHPPG